MEALDIKSLIKINSKALKRVKEFPGASNFFSLNKIVQLEDHASKTFNYRVKGDMVACNQERSGRCWLFASLSILRIKMIKQYKLDSDFKLSANTSFET